MIITTSYDERVPNPIVSGAPTEQIERAIQAMSFEYMELKYEGYMDGHRFHIERVTTPDGTELTKQDLNEMYYSAFGPECITFRLRY